ncbi:unnamed protein product [Rhodiola kirilowii]
MEVEGEVIRFDIFQAMKHPPEFASVHALDALDDLVQEVKLERGANPLKLALKRALYSHEDSYEFAETILDNITLPVIIKNELETDQERQLIEVLSSHKLAIGWTLANIRGISPAVRMHRILL